MTGSSCRVCGAPTDAFLCGSCADELEQAIAELPADVTDLEAVMTRQAGISPNNVRAITYDVIDAPLLRFTVNERDEDGALLYDRATKLIRSYDVEVALRGDLPAWWQPKEPA